ncbi:hypothetical protein DRN73_05260 [Candidatus Pacearchaeota archaeon]|nr:MAG: hypothetical protein DRN73_05260 [Candidatus Pacearchaeota archaeon]
MKLKDFKRTPYYKRYIIFIKAMGWRRFKKNYSTIVEIAKVWMEIERVKKETEKLLREELC